MAAIEAPSPVFELPFSCAACKVFRSRGEVSLLMASLPLSINPLVSCIHLSIYFTSNGRTKDTMSSLVNVCLLGMFAFLLRLSLAQNSPQDYLTAHNSARSQVGVSNIAWNATLAAYALTYANSRKADCNLVHSGGDYGENLAKGSGSFTGSAAVGLWVDEKPNYDYASNSCVNGPCLHYTQVVWRESVRVGCARVQCNNGWWFVGCNYDPAGNYIGEYPY